jgi:predicted phage terminase large subunit-like protein
VKNADEADSITYRDRVHEWYKTTLYSRREKGAGVCLIMTRWHSDDLAARLLAENPDDWKVVSFPMIAEEDEKYRKAGEPLWPAKYNLEECMRIKRSVGSRAWAALYQQKPAPAEGNIVNAKWFRHYAALPRDYLRKIISVDATFKKTDTGSYVCMQAWGKNNANHYLIDQIRKRMDFPETIKTLRDFCSKHYGYEAVVVEDKANGPAIIDTIRQVIPAVVSCSPHGSKESRLSSVSPMIEAGNVHLPLISENPWVLGFFWNF